MIVPSMLSMADVMADSGYAEEDVFDCGISGQIGFLVVVPLIGACRVPVEALSHFMAGADDYTAEGMPEHWSGALSGKWTIKRDRLRILESSWNIFSDNCVKLAEAWDAASQPSPAPVVAETTKQRRARLLDWYGKGERGAVQRVYERELLLNPKADRSSIGKEIHKAKNEKAETKRGGAMFSQLVKGGTRMG